MKGDFSRRFFKPGPEYAAALLQQGRVLLDSDWNAEVAERLERLRRETADIVGSSGFCGTAFQISPVPGDPSDFRIAHGDAYIDGILCEIDFDTTYLSQPFLLDPPAIPIPTDGSPLTAVVYLEAWDRLITYLQDPDIREVALNGPDTTTRIQSVAQVKLATVSSSVKDLTCPNAGSLLPTPPDGTLTVIQNPPPPPTDICRIPDLGTYTGRENRLYRVEIHRGGAVSGAVTSPPLHLIDPGFFLPATFKWSRDNAAFAVGVTAISADRLTLTLTSLGRDAATSLQQGDLVEITDDASDLGPGAGFLTNLASDPDPDQITVTLASALPSSFHVDPTSPPSGSPPSISASRHLILRRWDGTGVADAVFNADTTPDMDLGDGIQIQFGGYSLQPGDYWQFAARTDGSVESVSGSLPHGIRRHRTPIALLQWTRPVSCPPSSPPAAYGITVLHDCRTAIPRLAVPGLHVEATSVNSAAGTFSLVNDTNVGIDDIAGGIDVLLDAAPAPASLTRAVCSLTVQSPMPLSPAPTAYSQAVADPNKANVGFQPVVLPGTATVNGNTISWRPRNPGAFAALPYELLPPGDRGVLALFRIDGNFVWAQDNPQVFLDGDVFGFQQLRILSGLLNTVEVLGPGIGILPTGGTNRTLPSGDGRKGGTFLTWFWITPPPTLTFTLGAQTVNVVRSVGEAELIGQLVVTMTGGEPAAAGAPVPTYNIQVTLNRPLASALSSQLVDAVLLIDDSTTLNATALTAPVPINGAGAGGLNYKNGSVPNVFQGRATDSDSAILFANVPIDAPGAGQSRTVRIVNIRANLSPQPALQAASSSPPSLTVLPSTTLSLVSSPPAATTASPSSPSILNNTRLVEFLRKPGLTPTQIAAALPANVSATDLQQILPVDVVAIILLQVTATVTGFPTSLDPVSVGTIANGLATFEVHDPSDALTNPFRLTFPQMSQTGANPKAVAPHGFLHFREGYASAFKSRAQENGFTNPALPGIGQATQGTRLRAVFTGLPAGASLFVSMTNVSPIPSIANVVRANLVTTDSSGAGSGTPIAAGTINSGVQVAAIPIANGTAVAVWEWVAPTASTTVDEVVFAVVLGVANANVAGTVSVSGTLAPDTTALQVVPRFGDDPINVSPAFVLLAG
ncbi:MAG TPA: DUF6519 domain-containing protein [Bryobacteraceae bacterium]|nr:DUF6519 domain-containing protein [Bryobacteraceae bacterium]